MPALAMVAARAVTSARADGGRYCGGGGGGETGQPVLPG
jgi:hypothetical protein